MSDPTLAMRTDPVAAGENRVLDGIRVLDFTHLLAGPYLTRLMCDLGAEVIKLEPPGKGDESRHLPYLVTEGFSGYFIQQNCGKKSLCLDLNRSEAKTIVFDLVKVSDVVVENFAPGVMAKLGLDYASLKKVNSKLIMCSISGFGQTGPSIQRPATAGTIAAISGVRDPAGTPPEPPQGPRIAIADVNAATHGLAAITTALYYREKTGLGQHIDIAILDCLFGTIEIATQLHLLSGTGSTPAYAYLPYTTQDGGFVIINTYNEAIFGRFTKLMGKPELATDERFDSYTKRLQNYVELFAIIFEWFQTFETVDDVLPLLHNARIPSAPISTVERVVNDPQLAARAMLVETEQPFVGRVRVTNSPFRYSETVAGLRGHAPLIGEHNQEVLSGILGYPAEQIADFRRQGVLFTGKSEGSDGEGECR